MLHVIFSIVVIVSVLDLICLYKISKKVDDLKQDISNKMGY